MLELSPRRRQVLRSVVEEFVATAQPVSSETIARGLDEEVSSATVRHEMALLEEAGLVDQPHTSAGRVPTESGYRYYVEQLMDPTHALSPAEERTIRHQFGQVAGDPMELTHLASSMLARTLHSAAVATAPSTSRARVRRVELVPLQDDVVLVTLILQSGAVRQHVHHTEQSIARAELERLSNVLSHVLANKTVPQVKRSAHRFGADAHPFFECVVRLLQQAEEQAFAAIYYEGLAQLLAQPEFAQSRKLRPILEVLEQQPLLARLLAESVAGPGVQVIIGSENRLEQMREAAVVLTRYGAASEAWGVLGVVGPTRLPYWRVVPMVRFVAGVMELMVQESFGRSAT